MALKLVVSAIAMLFSTYFGYQIGQKFVRREKYFCQLLLFCNELRTKISFSQVRIADIFLQKAQNSEKELAKNLEEFVAFLATDDLSQNNLLKMLSRNDLNEQEIELVAQFFFSLGKSDAENQSRIIEGFCAIISEKHNLCREVRQKYKGLHTKLGFMGGLFIAILLL